MFSTSRANTARLLFMHLPEDFIFAMVDTVWTTLIGKSAIETGGNFKSEECTTNATKNCISRSKCQQKANSVDFLVWCECRKTLFNVLKEHF